MTGVIITTLQKTVGTIIHSSTSPQTEKQIPIEVVKVSVGNSVESQMKTENQSRTLNA